MQQQHAVPQQISSYQFRLIGDMTIKQFFQLAGGALIGLLIYALPLPSIIRWPLVIIAVISGAAFAFLPVQDRPLEEWLRAFFKAIYSPTIFTWQKAATAPDYFTENNTPTPASLPQTQVPAPSVPKKGTFLDNLEETEKSFLSRVGGLFGQGKSPIAPAQQNTQVIPPKTATIERPVVYQSAPAQTQVPAPSVSYAPPPAPKPVATPPVSKPQGVQIPTLENIRVATPVPAQGAGMIQENPAVMKVEVKPTPVTGTLNPEPPREPVAAVPAQFSPDAQPPAVPEQPNIVVGQVMDANGKIIEGALLEIRDKVGRPARALKTNKAGHFSIVTPLINNSYNIITEKDGYQFSTIQFNATGAVIPPIAIKAKNAINQ